jgi:hypothetical protein
MAQRARWRRLVIEDFQERQASAATARLLVHWRLQTAAFGRQRALLGAAADVFHAKWLRAKALRVGGRAAGS